MINVLRAHQHSVEFEEAVLEWRPKTWYGVKIVPVEELILATTNAYLFNKKYFNF